MTEQAIQEIRSHDGTVVRYKWGHIFQHLNDIMADIGSIKKEKSGSGISYKFRGVDQVYAALQPLLVRHKVMVLPTRTRDVRYDEAETKNGGALNYCRLTQEYTFFSCTDDSWVACEMPGEAMDTSDKATNKALSAAFKYLSFQGFCIPTDDPDQDADATSYEIKPRSQRQAQQQVEKGPRCPRGCTQELRTSQFGAKMLYCNRKSGGCGWDEEKDGWPGGSEDDQGEPYSSGNSPAEAGVIGNNGPVTDKEWERLYKVAEQQKWPKALVIMKCDQGKRKGLDSRVILNELMAKFSKPNERSADDEGLREEAQDIGF